MKSKQKPMRVLGNFYLGILALAALAFLALPSGTAQAQKKDAAAPSPQPSPTPYVSPLHNDHPSAGEQADFTALVADYIAAMKLRDAAALARKCGSEDDIVVAANAASKADINNSENVENFVRDYSSTLYPKNIQYNLDPSVRTRLQVKFNNERIVVLGRMLSVAHYHPAVIGDCPKQASTAAKPAAPSTAESGGLMDPNYPGLEVTPLKGPTLGTNRQATQVAGASSFNGDWTTLYGTLHFTVGGDNSVSARWIHKEPSEPWGPDITTATVTGNTMSGRWSNAYNQSEGTFELALNADRKAFTGSWTLVKGGGGSFGPWPGRRVSITRPAGSDQLRKGSTSASQNDANKAIDAQKHGAPR